MSKSDVISGRFGLAEHLIQEKMVIFIFETPFNVTGHGMAVIGGYGAETVEEIKVGESLKAIFDARSVVTFDEDIGARKKSNVSLRIGKYDAKGLLEDSFKCNFEFSTDVMQGRWKISSNSNVPRGISRKLLKEGDLLITRLD